MIQDIEPYFYNNDFIFREPKNDDFLMFFDGDEVYLNDSRETPRLPEFGEVAKPLSIAAAEPTFAFKLGERSFFLAPSDKKPETLGYKRFSLHIFREIMPLWIAFGGITASQYHRFYQNNKFCGRCGETLSRSEKERAMSCKRCGMVIYPRISPAVIVAVTDGNRLLLSKYSQGVYKRHALIAGFVEVGETLEQTVAREVMEEVGIKVKNIRYFGSQPWSFSDSVLCGYFCDLDGSDKLTIDKNELSEAEWFERENIPENLSLISLTATMIEAFRNKTFA